MDSLQPVVLHDPPHVLQAPLLEHPRQDEPCIALRIEIPEVVLREQPRERTRERHDEMIPHVPFTDCSPGAGQEQ